MSRAVGGNALAAGVAACHDPLVAPARLIGRDEDVAALRDALVSARAGEPRCVLVTGEAGIGKTRLVAEALAAPIDALVVTGHGADMATGEIPFGVLADTLRDLVRQCGPDVLDPVERAALAPLLPGSVPAGHVERVQVLSAFVDLLQRLCSERLLVWVVEDLHWADTATRDLVNLAVRTLHGRLLLVATVRTHDPERPAADESALTSYVAGLARLPATTVLPLGRLTPAEVRAQLVALAGSTLPHGVAVRIERLSDGVPFVVEELAAVRGRPEASTASAVAADRLAWLSAEARRLVDAAAVGEGHLRLGLLERVVDATPDELDSALVEAVRAGVLTTDPATDAVGFRHALLRDAADRELGPGARRSWHRRWAEVLQASPGLLPADPAALAIAEHWQHSRDVRQALAATVAALPSAERICRPDEEAVLWTRVMEAFAALDDASEVAGFSLRVAMARGAQAIGLASLSLSSTYWRAVPVDRLTDAERLAHALFLAQERVGKGELNLLPHELRNAAADAFEEADADELAIAVWAASGSRMPDDRGQRLVTRALAAARKLDRVRAVLMVAQVGSYRAQVNGDPAGAVAMLDEILSWYPDESGEGMLGVLGNLVWCETIQGHHDRADAVARDALGRLRHPHLSVGTWEHLVENATASWLMTGQWDRARKLFDESSPWWEDDLRTSNARSDLLLLLQRGAADVRRWHACVDRPATQGAARALIREVLARSAVLEGDLAAMRAALSPAWREDYFVLSDDQLWAAVGVASRAEADAALAGERDDHAEALAHLAEVQAAAARFRRYGPLGEVWPLDLAAQLDRFHGRDPRPALEAALAGWERIGHVPDTATTHLSLAEAHAVHGDREAARAHLTIGREIATRLGAGPMLARADSVAERFALASRERRTTDVLTAREAEVLSLLAEGRTNAEIAATLFMSPKTASVHVSHIIAKLGAANRTEAAATARRQGLLQ